MRAVNQGLSPLSNTRRVLEYAFAWDTSASAGSLDVELVPSESWLADAVLFIAKSWDVRCDGLQNLSD
jgi:hypothetical protein